MSRQDQPDRFARVLAGIGMGSLIGMALAGPAGSVIGVALGVLIGWPDPRDPT